VLHRDRKLVTVPNKIVVVGASAGGVESLRQVVGGVPPDFSAAIFVVLHIPPDRRSALPEILDSSGPLHASRPVDGQRIESGHIYVASPDHLLLVERGSIAVKRSPKENRFRPSIDALFQSAAYHYGADVIGVVLSGALDDGVPGLWSIKRFGGIAIVQEPSDAPTDSMPRAALRDVQVDYTAPATAIGGLLETLTRTPHDERLSAQRPFAQWTHPRPPVSDGADGLAETLSDIEDLVAFTCAHCRPILEQMKGLGAERLPDLMRSLERGVMLLQHVAQHMHARGNHSRARAVRQKQHTLEDRASRMRKLLATGTIRA
jgi:two-component system chemotaxis response regulator CheB